MMWASENKRVQPECALNNYLIKYVLFYNFSMLCMYKYTYKYNLSVKAQVENKYIMCLRDKQIRER